jgi:hypothetical protein
MANFRIKIFGLVGATVAFAGMAYGQASCNLFAGSFGLGQVSRAESVTDLVGETTLTCTAPGAPVLASQIGPPNTNAAITLFISAPVTSKVLTVAAPPNPQYTEALAVVSIPGGFPGVYSATQGVITPAGISFTNIPTPALNMNQAYQIQFLNVRVNTTGGATSITEQPFITGSTILVPGAPSALTVATVESGLAPAKLSSDFANTKPLSSTGLNSLICTALASQTANGTATNLQSPLFWIHTGETFQTSFKTQGPGGANAAADAAFGSEFLYNTETGVEPNAAANANGLPYAFNQTLSAGTANQASFGTRIIVTFANVPAGLALYVPEAIQSDTVAQGGQISLTSSATNALSPPTPVSTPATGLFGSYTGATTVNVGGGVSTIGTISALTVTAGSATAVYEVTAQNPLTIEAYSIPVIGVAAAGTLAVTTTAMTVTVSFAPIVTSTVAPLATIPSFISLSTAINAAIESPCSTTLLFPYILNSSAWDTGIAIENTSTDNLGKAGVSSATNQSGTCSANFYASNQGTGGSVTPSAAGTVFPGPIGSTGNVFAAGTGSATLLSILDPGFTGYAIILCNFQYAHGFAYIINGDSTFGGPNGTVMGYLAPVLATGSANRAAGGDIAAAGFETTTF